MDRSGQININDFQNTEEKILNLIKNNSRITQKEMCKILGIGRTTITNIIKQMRNKNILERVGSDRNGYWKVL